MQGTQCCTSRFLYLLAGCLVAGFAVGFISSYDGQPVTAMDAAYAAREKSPGQPGRGHAYGRQIADIMRDSQAKGKDKQAFLNELKQRGHRVSDKANSKAVKAADKRMKDNRASSKRAVDRALLGKAGREVLKRDKLKDAPEKVKAQVRRAHGLE